MSKKRPNGDGTIYKKTVTKKDGKQYTYWEAQVSVGYDPLTGKAIRKAYTGKTQEEVLEKMCRMHGENIDRVFFESEISRCEEGFPFSENSHGYVYFVSDGEFVKIGSAKNIESRMKQIQTGNPNPIELLAYVEFNSIYSARLFERSILNETSEFSAIGEWRKKSKTIEHYIKFANERRKK